METEHNTTVVITIGRNEGTEPMGLESWENFQQRVRNALNLSGANAVFTPETTATDNTRPTGRGVWENKIQEEAAAFVALIDRVHLPGLRAHMQALAAAYRQDAIGFIVADGTENFA